MSESYNSETNIFKNIAMEKDSIDDNIEKDLFKLPIWFYAPSVLVKDIKDDPSYIKNGRSYF
tara:strand:+ start:188 stop:373 length:186 start_codon:yes stop_codon:yes gene_type:complete